MSRASIKRGQKNKADPKSRAAPRKKRVKKISNFDRFIANIPISSQHLRKIITAAIVAFILLALFLFGRAMGVPQMIFDHYVDMSKRAGFEVKRVEVNGMNRVDQIRVYDLVLAEENRAMPLVDVERIRRDLLTYGWVKEVRVSRRLPDSLVVDIVEREPVARWKINGDIALVDSEGVILKDVEISGNDALILILGNGANQQVGSLNALLEKVSSLRPEIVAANWIGNRRWDIEFKTGEVLALPEGKEQAETAFVKFARMDGVNRLLGRGTLRFDMRDPDRAYFRVKTAQDKNESDDKKTDDSDDNSEKPAMPATSEEDGV
ncbi:hypothetical protein LPB140_09395 [Sphingorhabdus lutea]|uniref:Cell division protein FtsQ n=1 Tax=Sphingorhabdus lutea TaxID=1913578 RepID=A0A1L3JCW2_9SPHN|nr:FtsQ-type POTRA domain-containing protein [Sphingorhabdus lutea]APG62968.1 hypothetical protein LPB140_09395 [Sphingorhabdus lutea]